MNASAIARDASAARELIRAIASCAHLIAPRLGELGPMVQEVDWDGEGARSFKVRFEAALPDLNRVVAELQALEQDLLRQLKRQGIA